MTTEDQKKLWDAYHQAPRNSPEQMDALLSLIWCVTHDETMKDKEFIANLSLLSGIACAHLMDYRDILKEAVE